MIEDIDGLDTGPSRAPLVRAVSVVLVFAAIVGWAVVQSPELRGPYATADPRPNVAIEPISVGPAAISVRPGLVSTIPACFAMQQVRTGYGFVAGHSVTLVRVVTTPPPEADTFTAVTPAGVTLMWDRCRPDTTHPDWDVAP